MVLLELICEKGFSVINGKDKMLEEIHKVLRDYTRVKEELLESDEILTRIVHKPNSDYSVASEERRLTRILLDNLIKGIRCVLIQPKFII